jgi:hypothetical protein
MEAIGDLGLEDVRMSQAVRLGEILPDLMRQITERMQQRQKVAVQPGTKPGTASRGPGNAAEQPFRRKIKK